MSLFGKVVKKEKRYWKKCNDMIYTRSDIEAVSDEVI